MARCRLLARLPAAWHRLLALGLLALGDACLAG